MEPHAQRPPRQGGTGGKVSPQVSGLRDWVDGGPIHQESKVRGKEFSSEQAAHGVPEEPQNVKLAVSSWTWV